MLVNITPFVADQFTQGFFFVIVYFVIFSDILLYSLACDMYSACLRFLQTNSIIAGGSLHHLLYYLSNLLIIEMFSHWAERREIDKIISRIV